MPASSKDQEGEIMEYKVIKLQIPVFGEKILQDFAELINRYIAEGWCPQGGIFVTDAYLLQAMIRETK